MGIIAFIILGLLAGAIAKALLPGNDPGGAIVTMLIGIVGALLGGFLAGALFDADPLDEFFDLSTWLTAIVGSIVLLLIYRLVTGRRGGAVGVYVGSNARGSRPRGNVRTAVSPQPSSRQTNVLARRLPLVGRVDVQAAGLAAPLRARLAEAGRDRDDDSALAARVSTTSNSRRSATVLWWMWPARISSAPDSTSRARTWFRPRDRLLARAPGRAEQVVVEDDDP